MRHTLDESPLSPSTWQPCGAHHVAVYGTLRAGGINDIAKLRPNVRCMGRTLLTGTLHDLGWYPGLRLVGTQPVLAEVYDIDPALEQALDAIEGLYPHDLGEYTKRVLVLPVSDAHGATSKHPVLVYEALPATVAKAPVVTASDWLAWFESKNMGQPEGAFALNCAQRTSPH